MFYVWTYSFGVFLRFILKTGSSSRSVLLLNPDLDSNEPWFRLPQPDWSSLELPGPPRLLPASLGCTRMQRHSSGVCCWTRRCTGRERWRAVKQHQSCHVRSVYSWNACERCFYRSHACVFNYDGNIFLDTLAESSLCNYTFVINMQEELHLT